MDLKIGPSFSQFMGPQVHHLLWQSEALQIPGRVYWGSIERLSHGVFPWGEIDWHIALHVDTPFLVQHLSMRLSRHLTLWASIIKFPTRISQTVYLTASILDWACTVLSLSEGLPSVKATCFYYNRFICCLEYQFPPPYTSMWTTYCWCGEWHLIVMSQSPASITATFDAYWCDVTLCNMDISVASVWHWCRDVHMAWCRERTRNHGISLFNTG